MSNIEIKYTTTHEWAEILDSKECSVGITERAQEIYSNIIFIELPSLSEYEQDEIMGRVETSDGRNFYIHAPVSGAVYEINAALEEDIDLLNRFPEGDGWICKLHIENPSEIEALLTLPEYQVYEEEELNEEEYLPETDFYENIEDY
jgi:glycine cleavage system H protein